jgi:uracil phosphoribosyltransferase
VSTETATGVTVVTHPLVQHKLAYLRDRETPTVHFRKLANEVTLLLTYEATKDFPTEDAEVETPLERTNVERIAGKKVAVCPVLRAGLGMLDGVLSLVSSARVGFIGLYRDEETLHPVEYYVKLPELDERDAIVLDPMLATGRSSAAAVAAVKAAGARSVTLVCLVAAPEGIELLLQGEHPDVRVVTAAIDRGLDERGYIVPGLGDAGDRLYGTK